MKRQEPLKVIINFIPRQGEVLSCEGADALLEMLIRNTALR
jgi:hypothetical protein